MEGGGDMKGEEEGRGGSAGGRWWHWGRGEVESGGAEGGEGRGGECEPRDTSR